MSKQLNKKPYVAKNARDNSNVNSDLQHRINELSVQLDSMTKERDEYKSSNSAAVKLMNKQQEEINKLTKDFKAEKERSEMYKDKFQKTNFSKQELTISLAKEKKEHDFHVTKFNESLAYSVKQGQELNDIKQKWYVKLFGGWA